MSILSLISFFNAYIFVVAGFYTLKGNYKEARNRVAALCAACFAIWAFAYTFFYTAPTVEQAWFWHKLGSVGWTLFCVCAVHFYLELTGITKKTKSIWLYLAIYTLPLVILGKTLVTDESPVAKYLVQSQVGWGWAYVSNVESGWFWAYVFYMVVYFVGSLVMTYYLAKKSGQGLLIKQAISMIILVCTMCGIGFLTDLIIPIIKPGFLPPMFNIVSIFLALGLLFVVVRYRLIKIEEVASPDLILKTVMEPILMVNSEGYIEKCNQATSDLLKCSQEDIIGRRLSDFYISKQYQPYGLDQLIHNKGMTNVEVDLVDANDNIVNTMASYSVVETQVDGFIGIVISLHDVTEDTKLTQSLEKMANYDKLTELPNRRMFFDRLEAALLGYKNGGSKFALIFLDLDGFKAINDTYGHVVGDKLLIRVANMLLEETRKMDTIARIGGDEFILLFADLDEESELNVIIERLNDLFPGPINIDDTTCNIGISLGVSKCPEDGTSIDALMKVADDRMYVDKARKNP